MDRKIALKWAEALESGKYNQTEGYLHDSVGFCCLGVLCELYSEEKGDVTWEEDDEDNESYKFLDEHSTTPQDVCVWSGLKSVVGNLPHTIKSGYETLAEANDSGENFTYIAKIIRKHSEVL